MFRATRFRLIIEGRVWDVRRETLGFQDSPSRYERSGGNERFLFLNMKKAGQSIFFFSHRRCVRRCLTLSRVAMLKDSERN